MVMGPDTSPAASPPAIVETYTAQQLAAIRGDFTGPMADKDSLRHNLAVAAKPDPVSGASTQPTQANDPSGPPPLNHNPWSEDRRQQQINREINHASTDPATSYKPPPAIQAMLEERAAHDRSALVQRLHISAVRADAGLGTVDRDAIVKLQSLAPEAVERAVVENMERKLAFLKPGDTLPVSTERTPVPLRLTADQTAALLRMRDDYRKSDSEITDRTPEQIRQMRADYVKLCEHFMVRDLNGMHQTLLQHAFTGFNSRDCAEAIRGILKDTSKTDLDRKLALNSEISKAGPDHFAAVMSDYQMLPEREMAKSLYEAVANKDLNAMRTILGPRSREDCARLLDRADQYAEANHLKKPEELLVAYKDKESPIAAEYKVLMRGIDIKGRAADAYRAVDHTITNHADELRAAFAELKDAKGKTISSALTADQIMAIRDEVAAIAVTKGKDPAKMLAAVDKQGKGVVDKPVAEVAPQRLNFRADVAKGNLKIEEVVGVATHATTYGFDAGDCTLRLRHAVEEFNGSDPSKTNPDRILTLLKFGSDPARTQFLSPLELGIVIQAYDSKDPAGPNLRQTLDKKLTGDARIQALQIIDQAFYAGQEAEVLQHDMNRLLKIGDGVERSQDLMDRITQTDKEYKLRTGKTLVEGINEGSLSSERKAILTTVAMLPTLDTLHDEFKKPAPDKAVIEGLMGIPNLEGMYNAVYSKDQRNLRGTLEQFGREGKLSRDFVLEQECVLEGMPKDTFKRLSAELDAAKPAVGTRTSVLRDKSEAQLNLIMSGFEYAEEERAAARNQPVNTLVDHINQLNDDKRISSEQAVRAAMMLNGNDPFKTSDKIFDVLNTPIPPGADQDKQKQIALNKVTVVSQLIAQDGADPIVALSSANQVRKIYEQEHAGARILDSVVADKNIVLAFNNETEKHEIWVDAVAASIYGPGKGEMISGMMRAGNNPWIMSDEIAAALAVTPKTGATDQELKDYALTKLSVIARLAPADAVPAEIKLKTPNLDFQQTQVVREIYMEQHSKQDGGVIMRSILADKKLVLDNDPEQAKFGKLLDGIAKNMYGEGMGDIVLDLEATISGLREAHKGLQAGLNLAGVPQEELDKNRAAVAQNYEKLKTNLEAGAGWGYLANESEMYSAFFGPTIAEEVAALEKSGAITAAQKAELEKAMTAPQ